MQNYTPLTDPELDGMVSEITTLFPYGGEKSVSSRLRSCGILVKHDRIRASLQRVNPSTQQGCFTSKYHLPMHYGTWMVIIN